MKSPIILEGNYRIYPNLIKENRRTWTCNRLELQTPGSQLVMPKSLPDHLQRATIFGRIALFSPFPSYDRGEQSIVDEQVEVQDCRKITDHVRGMYRIYPNLIKENLRMSTCNRLDLQTLGSQPVVMPKNLPGHRFRFFYRNHVPLNSTMLVNRVAEK